VTTLPDYRVDDVALERLPRAQLESLQDERLRTMAAYAHQRSGFYRDRFAAAGVASSDITGIADLPKLPFLTRSELDAEQLAHPPFGDYTCSPRESWMGLFTTSGTSGRKLKRVFSRRDWELMLGRFRRHPFAEPGDIAMMLGPIDGLVGPSVAVEAWRRAGAIPVLAGLWDTRTKARAIAELRPAIVAGAASYLMHLAEVAAELGIDLSDCGIRSLNSFGEPGAAVDATRATLEQHYHPPVMFDGYGLSELWPLGGNCPHSQALHIPEDFAAVECVDPDSGEQVPDGEQGELVYTNLIGDTQPLLRYRSRDIGRLRREPACECGSTYARIERIEGRTDDMVWYRGANFFPSAVEDIVRRQPGLSPEYRIVLDQAEGGLPRLTIQVEGDANDPRLRSALAGDLRGGLGVAPDIEVLAVGELPRITQGKAKRLLDRREQATSTTTTGGQR